VVVLEAMQEMVVLAQEVELLGIQLLAMDQQALVAVVAVVLQEQLSLVKQMVLVVA
jgi:hypothetical protein